MAPLRRRRYLVDVRLGEVRGNRAERGMNGILLVRTDSVRLWNNVVSFNSGIGFGLYRSSDNVIIHNHADYNVRGYSHGFYRRGQDSAALLIYEQSCRNVVAYNSMTHGGDGLFLWAGQTTMDTGKGGRTTICSTKRLQLRADERHGGDVQPQHVRHEPRRGSDHGLWGGYSFDSQDRGQRFSRNRIGIAIEHGQNNDITHNRFVGDSTGISLLGEAGEPSGGAIPGSDTRSRDYRIRDNVFVGERVAVRAVTTQGTRLTGNLSCESTPRTCFATRRIGASRASRRRRGKRRCAGSVDDRRCQRALPRLSRRDANGLDLFWAPCVGSVGDRCHRVGTVRLDLSTSLAVGQRASDTAACACSGRPGGGA
jgi:parallel beta-helix repeat protein